MTEAAGTGAEGFDRETGEGDRDARLEGAPSGLYRPDLWRAARDIPVASAAHVFIWPLVLRIPDARAGAPDFALKMRREAIGDLLAEQRDGAPVWEEIEDLLRHADQPSSMSTAASTDPADRVSGAKTDDLDERRAAYAEFVYFYDFLQNVLFRKNERRSGSGQALGLDGSEPVIRLFRRKDVARLTVWLDATTRAAAEIKRCNLYLFGTGAAALVVEAALHPRLYGPDDQPPKDPLTRRDGDTALTLDRVQTLIDRMRRCYPPYYDDKSAPGLVPHRLAFEDRAGQPIIVPGTPEAAACEHVGNMLPFDAPGGAWATIAPDPKTGRRNAPVMAQWRGLLAPLRIDGYAFGDDAADQPVWRHVVDERIPMMSFVSVTGAYEAANKVRHPSLDGWPEGDRRDHERNRRAGLDLHSISRGDWMRLCFADAAGSWDLPYSPHFLADFERKSCYDRFFPSTVSQGASRAVFAGYHTAFVGAGGFFDGLISQHFRRHYFQMALILTMEFASLLSLSSRISAQVTNLKRTADVGTNSDVAADFRDAMLQIERDFLAFVHIYRFTGISNQIQPHEMFCKWRESLGLDALFDDVKEELQAATQFLLSMEQTRQADSANRLAVIATVGLIVGLAAAVLSMNFLLAPELFPRLFGMPGVSRAGEAPGEWPVFLHHLRVVLATFGATSFAGFGLMWLLGDKAAATDRTTRKLMSFALVSGVLSALGFVVATIMMSNPGP